MGHPDSVILLVLLLPYYKSLPKVKKHWEAKGNLKNEIPKKSQSNPINTTRARTRTLGIIANVG